MLYSVYTCAYKGVGVLHSSKFAREESFCAYMHENMLGIGHA